MLSFHEESHIQGDLECGKPYPKQERVEAMQYSAAPQRDRLRIPATGSLDE